MKTMKTPVIEYVQCLFTITATSTIEPPAPPHDSAKAIIDTILASHATLLSFPDLSPSPKVNAAFSKLVSVCLQHVNEAVVQGVLTSPAILGILPSLHSLCSHGESRLEHFWANKISSSNSPDAAQATLETFPYTTNYALLTTLELHALSIATPLKTLHRIAFIGCGPLPLSSLCLLSQLRCKPDHPQTSTTPKKNSNDNNDISVVNIDNDIRALSLAEKLARGLRYDDSEMSFLCADANDILGLQDVNVVFLAALVGSTVLEKQAVLLNLVKSLRKGVVVVIRSAKGLRSMLYPVIEARDLVTGGLEGKLEVVTVVHPEDQVVNSVIVARVMGA